MELTRTVKVTITHSELLNFFVDAVAGHAQASEGKQRTLWQALAFLIGITAKETVKKANQTARQKGQETITLAEFRKWLPEAFSQFAKEALAE